MNLRVFPLAIGWVLITPECLRFHWSKQRFHCCRMVTEVSPDCIKICLNSINFSALCNYFSIETMSIDEDI